MGDSTNNISLDDLSEIYRVEKKSRGLSTVRMDLFSAMAQLLKETRKSYDESLRSDPDAVKCEIINARRKKTEQLSRDIIDMRMRKIAQLALRNTIAGSAPLDLLTPEEKEYYDKIHDASHRHVGLLNRLSGNIRYTNQDITKIGQPEPVAEEPIPIPQPEETVEEYYEPEDDIPAEVVDTATEPVAERKTEPVEEIPAEVPLDLVPDIGEFDADEVQEMDIPEDELDRMDPEQSVEEEPSKEPELVLLRITTDIAEFAGYNTTYNLKAKDVVSMPALIAKALVERKFAEVIHNSA